VSALRLVALTMVLRSYCTRPRPNDGDQVYDLLGREGPYRVWDWQSINPDSLGSIDEGPLSASLLPA